MTSKKTFSIGNVTVVVESTYKENGETLVKLVEDMIARDPELWYDRYGVKGGCDEKEAST